MHNSVHFVHAALLRLSAATCHRFALRRPIVATDALGGIQYHGGRHATQVAIEAMHALAAPSDVRLIDALWVLPDAAPTP
jgi:hypothetical protein